MIAILDLYYNDEEKQKRLDKKITKLQSMYEQKGFDESKYKKEDFSIEKLLNRASFWMATGSGKSIVMIKLIEILYQLSSKEYIDKNDILILAPTNKILKQVKEHIEDFNKHSNFTLELNSLKEVTNPSRNSFGENLENFDNNFFLQPFKGSFRGPETGAVPVKTSKGWLIIYCGTAIGREIWTINALLLDLNNPRKIIGIAPKPILSPQTGSELKGVVNNVTFPSGAAIVKDELYVYYGSGDQGCCLAICKLNELLAYLLKNPPTHKLMGEQVRRL